MFVIFCNKFRNTMHTKRFKAQNKTETKNLKFKPYKLKSKEEIQSEYIALSKKYKKLEKEYKKVKGKLIEAEKVLSDDDKDLREMFCNLKDGINQINERVENPTCKWTDCESSTFTTLSELTVHIEQVHVNQDDQTNAAPVNKEYLCRWENCNLKFQKKYNLITFRRRTH